MLSLAHQIPILILTEEPWLLPLLAEKLLGKTCPDTLRRADSTVRFGNARELRPDAIFETADGTRWVALEVQLRLDRCKARRWPVLVAILLREHDTMGDLVILTPHRSVAEWARGACREVGALGTWNRMVPTVLWVSDRKVNRLLDKAYPRLAFFAAWAMHTRYGPRAQAVVQKALEITNLLPKPLRESQRQAIFDVLNKRLRSRLKEKPMPLRITKIPESPFFNQWWAELRAEVRAAEEAIGAAQGKAEGKREALFTIFNARGLQLSPGKKLESCGVRIFPRSTNGSPVPSTPPAQGKRSHVRRSK